ncbi:MAG: ABC transporter permease [Reichenbachiella sp.]|uniref:ABC transporter permease n=1 Tax=Reichenbachiella sp. TaxID=2184521 RepID=UPI0032982F70
MNRKSPPPWMDRILEWYCSEQFIEEVQGDLHEWYDKISGKANSRMTNLKYLLAVFQYFSFFRTKPFQKLISHPNYLSMKSIALITFRNFKKNKLSGIVRLTNLVLGIGIFLLSLIYIRYELSYEAYHEKADNIYRVGFAFEASPWAAIPVGVGIFALENSPEVKNMTRFLRIWNTTIKYKDRQFYETGGFMADSSVFKMFSYHMLQGDPNTALQEKMSIVLTQSMAQKYFGNEDPIGKMLTISRDYDSETGEQHTRMVTGVIQDIPEQSHLRFDFLLPAHTFDDDFLRQWRNFWVYTFLEIDDGADFEITKAIIKNKHVTLRNYDEDIISKIDILLTPLKKIHLYANHEKEYADNGNIYYVYILFFIGLFILIVSSINFINLTIIHGLDRAREVGLRKTVGASRYQLILQFMSENLILLFIAGTLCLLLLGLLEPLFQQFSGLNLPLNVINNPEIIISLIVLLTILELVSGIYPALVLSRFRPADIIKTGGQSTPLKRVSITRKALIVMQFTISLILVIGSVIVYDQLNFIQNKDLGFEKDQILLIELNSSVGTSFEAFENELRGVPGIRSISTSSSVPGYRIMMEGAKQLGSDEEIDTRLLFTDETFMETYDMNLVAGKSFKEQLPEGETEFILNETAARELFGSDDPINQPIVSSHDTGYVVGVVKDFNFKSLHSDIDPLTIQNRNLMNFGFASIKFEAKATSSVMQAIDKASRKVYPNLPLLSYEFLDERFEQLYLAESKLKTIVWVFCVITILLTVSGILGIATYSAKKRAKEIAIRKVLGGNIAEMITILSKSFLYLLLVSLVIGLPGAFILSDWWLQDFAYRISINPIIFVASALIMAVLIMLSFGFMTLKTAQTNPAEVLKSE